jgi:hypothetical protein
MTTAAKLNSGHTCPFQEAKLMEAVSTLLSLPRCTSTTPPRVYKTTRRT